MATLNVTNISAAPVYLSDLYSTIQPGITLSTTRAASDLSRMASLHAAIQAGTVACSVQYSGAEQASGMLGLDIAGVTADDSASQEVVIRKVMVAGVGGTADDILVYAANQLPSAKMRVTMVEAMISSASAGSTVQVRTAIAGGGTLCGEVSSAAVGHVEMDNTVTASQLLTSGPSVGLWVHRSNNTVAGEVFITIRSEQ